ncbi:hypothetical protein BGZ60DRAFT_402004 [Tricladium varicosporioides]|nr:hypothetical protein BGZ60DRAFT_402004 [Hymenoscyphus varicosporioides]
MFFATFITTFPTYLHLSTLLLLSTTTLIRRRVEIHGSNPAFPKTTKFNSIVYSFFSLVLCLALLYSILIPMTSEKSTWGTLICYLPTMKLDHALAKVFHYSKLYEYVDIINVLASGGSVNTHFWFHHLTVPCPPLKKTR